MEKNWIILPPHRQRRSAKSCESCQPNQYRYCGILFNKIGTHTYRQKGRTMCEILWSNVWAPSREKGSYALMAAHGKATIESRNENLPEPVSKRSKQACVYPRRLFSSHSAFVAPIHLANDPSNSMHKRKKGSRKKEEKKAANKTTMATLHHNNVFSTSLTLCRQSLIDFQFMNDVEKGTDSIFSSGIRPATAPPDGRWWCGCPGQWWQTGICLGAMDFLVSFFFFFCYARVFNILMNVWFFGFSLCLSLSDARCGDCRGAAIVVAGVVLGRQCRFTQPTKHWIYLMPSMLTSSLLLLTDLHIFI